MSRKINWLKIVANTGYTYFLTLAGMLTADKLMNTERPIKEYILICLLVAFINAMIVFFAQIIQTLNNQTKRRPRPKKTSSKQIGKNTTDKPDEPKGREKFIIDMFFLF